MVMAFIVLAGVGADFTQWAVEGSRPEPWFASVPYLYIPVALWMLYRTRREPPLLQAIQVSIAGALLLLALGPEWQARSPIWLAVRALNVVAGCCMFVGAWPAARLVERVVGVGAGVLMFAWAFLPPGTRRPVSFAVVGAMLYGIVASAALRSRGVAGSDPKHGSLNQRAAEQGVAADERALDREPPARS